MGTQQFPHPGVQRGFWWGYGAVSIFAPQPWDSPHPVVSSSPISPGFTHPAQLSTASSSRDDLRGLLGLGPYPRAGAMCVGLAAVFHNKSRWELNVPGSEPEASSAPCFSAALSLGLNLQSVITAPIRHWKPAMLIMAFLIPPPAIFFSSWPAQGGLSRSRPPWRWGGAEWLALVWPGINPPSLTLSRTSAAKNVRAALPGAPVPLQRPLHHQHPAGRGGGRVASLRGHGGLRGHAALGQHPLHQDLRLQHAGRGARLRALCQQQGCGRSQEGEALAGRPPLHPRGKAGPDVSRLCSAWVPGDAPGSAPW